MSRGLAGALLALVLLAPLAAAGDPEPLAWSPYVAPAAVNAVALAAEGKTVGVAYAPVPAPSGIPGGAPTVERNDLAILDLGVGFAAKGGNLAPPQGRTLVAVSRDGTSVASINNDTTELGATDPTVPRRTLLQFTRAESGNLTQPTLWANHTLDGNAVVGLAVSDNGRRVVVASNHLGKLSLRGYQLTPGGLVATFHYQTDGEVKAVASDGPLDTLFAATRLPQGSDVTRAVLLALPFQVGIPSATYADTVENGTFRSVSASRDGGRVAIGTEDGRLLLFQGNQAGLPALGSRTLGAAVGPVALSEDGRRAAAVHGTNLTHLDVSEAEPRPLWAATGSRAPASLAYNRTGAILVVGVPGDGLYAYGDLDERPLWRNPGDARSVGIQSSGDVVVVARVATLAAFRLPRNVTLDQAAGGDASPLKLVRPGGTLLYEVVLRNGGATPESVRLEAPEVENLRIAFDPPAAHLRPGESRRVNVTVEADAGFAGDRAFNVSTVALTSSVRDETRIRVGLQTAANVSLVLDRTDLVVPRDEATTLLVGIQNRGNKDAAVGVRATHRASAGAPWDVQVDPPSLTLAPGSITTVRLVVTPPAGVANGTSLALTLSLEGQDVADSAVLTFRINPTLGIEVGATPRIKFVQPGKAAHYNVTVKNSGSVPRSFTAWYDVLPGEGGQPRPWAVDVQTSEFRLEAGATRTLPVRIIAPADVTPSDRVSVRVTAQMVPLNDTETPILGNVTLFANGEAPPPTPVPDGGNPVPGPGAPLVAAALAAALGLLRRRRK